MSNEMIGKIVFPNKIREFGLISWLSKETRHFVGECFESESNYVILSGPVYDDFYGWHVKVIPFGYNEPCFLYYKEVYEDTQTQGRQPQFHMIDPDDLPPPPHHEPDWEEEDDD